MMSGRTLDSRVTVSYIVLAVLVVGSVCFFAMSVGSHAGAHSENCTLVPMATLCGISYAQHTAWQSKYVPWSKQNDITLALLFLAAVAILVVGTYRRLSLSPPIAFQFNKRIYVRSAPRDFVREALSAGILHPKVF